MKEQIESRPARLPKVDLSLSRTYRTSAAAAPPLRVGIMMDGTATLRCFREVLADIQACNFANIECVVVNAAASVARRNKWSLARRAALLLTDASVRQHIAYTAYLKLLDSRYRRPNDPTESVDCSALLKDIPVVQAAPIVRRFVTYIPPESVAAIRSFNLDVMIRFGFGILHGDVLSAARYGVWSYHHGDSQRYRGGPACVWELIERNPVSGAVLQVLSEELDGGLAVAKAQFATTHLPSVSENRFAVFWGSQHFVIRTMFQLHNHGWDSIRERAFPTTPYSGKTRIYRTPKNRAVIGWISRTFVTKVKARLKEHGLVPHWQIGLRTTSTPLYLGPNRAKLSEYRWLKSPRGHFWADPFLFVEQGITYLFFEDFNYAERKGSISCAEVASDGSVSAVRVVLERPYHLSYPQLCRAGGSIYMIPESEQSGYVELYRATKFPTEWVLEQRLLNLRAVDPTVFEYQGRWWMFVSPIAVAGHAPMTLVFSAPSLLGSWAEQKASPISCDVRTARSAGAIIVEADRLIRPSQDCSARYGSALLFNEILKIDPACYEEAVIRDVKPDIGLRQLGIHTYSRVGAWEAIDGQFNVASRKIL
jgi:hypothetical protein